MSLRLIRGVTAATLATTLAATSHLAGGGHLPSLGVVLLTLVLSALVSTALTGRGISLWRLSVSVGVSQGLFHTLFALAPASGHVHSPAIMNHAGHASHSMALPEAGISAADSMDSMGYDSPGMWLSHALAAAATVALIRRGESTLLHLLNLLGLMWLRVIALFVPLASPASPGARPDSWPIRVFASLGVPLLGLRHRGPPLTSSPVRVASFLRG